MVWILAISAYLMNAIVFIVDKYLLAQNVKNPNTYAFYVAIFSSFALVLIPFGVEIPSLTNLAISLGSGFSFFIGLLFLYRALEKIDVTEVSPAIGALTAVTTAWLSIWFARSQFNGSQFIALALLIFGTFLMSYFKMSRRLIWSIVGAALMFGLSYVLLKLCFDNTSFITGLFWSRMGLVFAGLATLILPKERKDIFSAQKQSSGESKFIFIANKVMAGAAAVLIYYAIKEGNVVFVNSLQGVQYVFILFIGAGLASHYPKVFEEHKKEITFRKLSGTVCIVLGLVLLFVNLNI